MQDIAQLVERRVVASKVESSKLSVLPIVNLWRVGSVKERLARGLETGGLIPPTLHHIKK